MKNLKGPFGEQLQFQKKFLKKDLKAKNSVWFVDDVFKNHEFCSQMERKVFLKGGESLKTLKSYEQNLKTLLKWKVKKTDTLYAVGGGSLGDAIGFLASTYLRGVQFVQVPSTWLAAVDSSLGGKTALNYGTAKNQIGSFYPPQKILFIKDLLETSAKEQSLGEVYKTLMLSHRKSKAQKLLNSKNTISFETLDYFLKFKTEVVKKDPFDTKGKRAVLNFGHSLGHILELKFKLSHSDAVLYGLRFSLAWSHRKGLLDQKTLETFLKKLPEFKTWCFSISESSFFKALEKDKKMTSQTQLQFVFLSNKGPLLQKVSLNSFYKEYLRQKKEFKN